MCFKPKTFFGIKPELGSKIFGIIYTNLAFLATILYGTPTILLETLPVSTRWFYCYMAIMNFLMFIFGITLLIGIFKKKPFYMNFWIILSYCLSFGLIVFDILCLIVLIWSGEMDISVSIMNLIYAIYGCFLLYTVKAMHVYQEDLYNAKARNEFEHLMKNIQSTKTIDERSYVANLDV